MTSLARWVGWLGPLGSTTLQESIARALPTVRYASPPLVPGPTAAATVMCLAVPGTGRRRRARNPGRRPSLRAGTPHEKLAAYADKHQDRTLLPMAVMPFTGLGGSVRPRHLRETAAQ